MNKNKIVNKIIKLIIKNYIYTDKAKCLSIVLKNNIELNKYDNLLQEEFINSINKDIYKVLKDKHVLVALKDTKRKKTQSCIRNVSILKNNIGYFRLDCFPPLEKSKRNIISGMKLLENVNAIIFDLRFNKGGYTNTVNFIQSFLFQNKTLLNIFYFKNKQGKSLKFKSYTLSKKELDKELTNKQNRNVRNAVRTFYKIPIVVLIGKNTFSVAEAFAYNLQTRKRATIMGRTSSGASTKGKVYNLTKTLQIFISIEQTQNFISKDNWEGIGVKPDIMIYSDDKNKAITFLSRKGKIE